MERKNRAILFGIAKLSTEHLKRWYKYDRKVHTAVNSHVHCSTNFTPFEVMFGMQIRSKSDDNLLQQLQEEIMVNFDKNRRKIREDVKQQIVKALQMYKKCYDKSRKADRKYKVGDLVAVKRTQFIEGYKLASEFYGLI